MTAPSSRDDREWLADYLGRLEASRQEWHVNDTLKRQAAIGKRQAPQYEQPERIIINPVSE
jgi:hypothetical protein